MGLMVQKGYRCRPLLDAKSTDPLSVPVPHAGTAGRLRRAREKAEEKEGRRRLEPVSDCEGLELGILAQAFERLLGEVLHAGIAAVVGLRTFERLQGVLRFAEQ